MHLNHLLHSGLNKHLTSLTTYQTVAPVTWTTILTHSRQSSPIWRTWPLWQAPIVHFFSVGHPAVGRAKGTNQVNDRDHLDLIAEPVDGYLSPRNDAVNIVFGI